MSIRVYRSKLGLSQSKLARMSGVSRFKICTHELGDCTLSPDELLRIQEALQAEAIRLRNLPAKIDIGQIYSTAGAGVG